MAFAHEIISGDDRKKYNLDTLIENQKTKLTLFLSMEIEDL